MRRRFDYYLVVGRGRNYRGWVALGVTALGFIAGVSFLPWFLSLVLSGVLGMVVYARLRTTRSR